MHVHIHCTCASVVSCTPTTPRVCAADFCGVMETIKAIKDVVLVLTHSHSLSLSLSLSHDSFCGLPL